MAIAKMVKKAFLVVAGCLVLSSVTWGQSWGPRVRVEFGGPPVRVNRWNEERWGEERWERRREWREHEWQERQRFRACRRYRREEWREHYRGY